MKLSCRNCGNTVVDFRTAKAAVQKGYNYTDEELVTTKSIRVWHKDCAIADGRIDTADESSAKDYHWEVR